MTTAIHQASATHQASASSPSTQEAPHPAQRVPRRTRRPRRSAADTPLPDLSSDQVAAIALAASMASEWAGTCWDRWLVAVREDVDVLGVRRELDQAVAAQVYAWAVHHSVADRAEMVAR